MANAELLVAHRGSSHVLPELWAQSNQAQYGADNYVLSFANNFSYTIVDNTHVTVKKGIATIQGRPAILPADVTVVIENGSTGYFRKDLICMRLDRTDGIENANVVVIKGTPVLSGAVDPTYNVGDFNTTVNIVDYPLLRVNVNELVISTVDTLFTVTTQLADISAKPITFTQAATRTALATADSLATLFGKAKKWFSDLETRGILTDSLYNNYKLNPLDLTLSDGKYGVSSGNAGTTNIPIATIKGYFEITRYDDNSRICKICDYLAKNEWTNSYNGSTWSGWVKRVNSSDIDGIQTKQGSIVLTGSGVNYVQIFTLTSLRAMFGVGVEKTASDFVVLVTNGDEVASNNRVLGTAINPSSGICWVSLASSLSTQIRINYIVSLK